MHNLGTALCIAITLACRIHITTMMRTISRCYGVTWPPSVRVDPVSCV